MTAAQGGGRPRSLGLRRARVLSRMGTGADLTLVIAPAGSGKTTLLAQFAASVPEPVGWHRCEPSDGDEERLATHLRAALLTAGLAPPAASPHDASLRGLARKLDGWTHAAARTPSALLVLDDFHAVIGTPAEAAFEEFLARRPAALRVVVASRRMPEVTLARAELGTVAVVTADDLRFRSWEVEKLFGEVYGEPLPPAEAAALARRTEGWAASLHLFHLATQGRRPEERSAAVGALTSRSRYARSYLARNVLDDLPPALRDFLRRTCVLEVLTADRCDRLLGTDSAQQQLEELEAKQALTTSEDDGRSFRYHEVLRRHLESALISELGGAGARRWYAAAAKLLEEEGALGEAIRAYALAEQWPDAVRLLPAAGGDIVGDRAGLAWPALLPAELLESDPWLSLALARRLARDGAVSPAAARYRHAEGLFADRRDREVAAAERRVVEVWAGAPAQPHLHWLDAVRAALRRNPLAVPHEWQAEPTARLAGALVLVAAGEVEEAARRLEGLDAVLPAGAASLAARLAALALELALTEGDSAGLRERHDRLVSDAERDGYCWIVRQCHALAPLLSLHEGGSPDLRAAAAVVAECDRRGDPWGALLAAGMLALAQLIGGHPPDRWPDVARRAAVLDAGCLQAWASAFGALAAAREHAADASTCADVAERLARSAGSAGAALVAVAAAAPAADHRLAAPLPAWLARLEFRGAPGPFIPAPLPRLRAAARPAPGGPALTLRCFGGFRMELAGRQLEWGSLRPRAVATLRMLAVHAGRQVHRETLMDALWPGVAAAQATRNLQVAISSLRRFMEPDAPRGESTLVVRIGDAYALVPPTGSDVDVVRFRTSLEQARLGRSAGDTTAQLAGLEGALAAYEGDLLPEDGPAEWVVGPRDRARVQAARAACELAEAEVARGKYAAAVAAARRSLELDAFGDASWRALIAAYEGSGDAGAAGRARQEYAAALEALGVPGGF